MLIEREQNKIAGLFKKSLFRGCFIIGFICCVVYISWKVGRWFGDKIVGPVSKKKYSLSKA